jgi:hypothetical protein
LKKSDRTNIGPLLLFTIRDVEYFEQLAHPVGAEKLMLKYAEHIERNPYDRNSMFHVYAMRKYDESQLKGGFVDRTVNQILSRIEAERQRRIATFIAQTDEGESQNPKNSETRT